MEFESFLRMRPDLKGHEQLAPEITSRTRWFSWLRKRTLRRPHVNLRLT